MPINTTPKNKAENNTVVHTSLTSIPLYSFDDIILSTTTMNEIDSVLSFYRNRILIFDKWGLGKVYRKQNSLCVNLHGKSGTGKTMVAHAIANALGMKLLIVNYSEIESKYVGETSKNLVSLFKLAKNESSIMLFDEADALLSKRVTSMSSATDVSVNQTRNVLLKLLDEYDGMVLFTTNFLENYDKAFLRRILFHISFDLPNEEARRKLWEHYLVEGFPTEIDKQSMISRLAERDGVTGADISNAVLKTAISVARKSPKVAALSDFLDEIEKIKITSSLLDEEKYEINSRKVSAEYVKNQLSKGND